MATRAGVGECSTSPMAHTEQRAVHSGQLDDRILGRRIRSMSASIVSRCATTAATSWRASAAAVALPSARRGGARGPRRRCAGRSRPRRRSRGRGGGRSGRRGPYLQPTRGSPRGQPPTPSTVTVTESSWRPSRRSTVAPTADRTWRVERDERVARPGDDPDVGRGRRSPAVLIATGGRRGASARPGRRGRPGATPGTSNAASRTISRDHAACRRSGRGRSRDGLQRTARRARSRGRRIARGGSRPPSSRRSASAISSGTRVRAIVAATSTP